MPRSTLGVSREFREQIQRHESIVNGRRAELGKPRLTRRQYLEMVFSIAFAETYETYTAYTPENAQLLIDCRADIVEPITSDSS